MGIALAFAVVVTKTYYFLSTERIAYIFNNIELGRCYPPRSRLGPFYAVREALLALGFENLRIAEKRFWYAVDIASVTAALLIFRSTVERFFRSRPYSIVALLPFAYAVLWQFNTIESGGDWVPYTGLSLLFMTTGLALVLANRPGWLLAMIPFAIANREATIFLVLLYAALRVRLAAPFSVGTSWARNRSVLLWCGGMVLAGVGTYMVLKLSLREPPGCDAFQQFDLKGFVLRTTGNLKYIFLVSDGRVTIGDIYNSITIFSVWGLLIFPLVFCWRLLDEIAIRLLAVVAAFWLFMFVHSVMAETRVMTDMAPLVALAFAILARQIATEANHDRTTADPERRDP
ncbi:MAG: hypothetical protein FJX46_09130 [Alphaproteobacteria bacterium]|nr:hypothetical protein [Alphaproteobacteria bacterium]